MTTNSTTERKCLNHCGHDPMTYDFQGLCSRHVRGQSETGWVKCGHRCEFPPDSPEQHEFVRDLRGQDECIAHVEEIGGEYFACSQPESAPVHAQGETPAQSKLRGRDTDWDQVEAEQVKRNLKSWAALPEIDRLRIAAEECAHWNRLYREATWESAREAVSIRSTPAITPDAAMRVAEKIVESLRDGFTNITATKQRVAAIITAEIGTPLGMEQCLAELREMFPGKFIRVRRTEATTYSHAFVMVLTVGEFSGATLTEAMQKVRDWKQKRPPASTKTQRILVIEDGVSIVRPGRKTGKDVIGK